MAYRLLGGLLWVSSLAAANLPIRVDDSNIRIVLDRGRTAVRFPLENHSGRTIAASVRLEWLTVKGETAAREDRVLPIAPGADHPVIPFPLPDPRKGDPIWYRLRYRFDVEGADIHGIVPFANRAGHAFEIRFSAPQEATPGETYLLRVDTRHPLTGAPVAGVTVRASLDTDKDGDKQPVVTKAISDASGMATVRFTIPKDLTDDDVDVEIEGTLGDFVQSADATVTLDRRVQLRIDTDKPLYQPGQSFHLRLLCRDSAGRAVPEAELTIRIKDPENTVAHSMTVVTNRYGVAASDWQIPANTRLGDYQIEVQKGGEDGAPLGLRYVKISRYDLPEFTVTAKPDRAYYLPGQDPVIEIHADYLFGKPVPRGHVRLVHETSRRWNYRLQKWETEEDESQEGDADASGRFVAHVNLAKQQDDFSEAPTGQYEDVTYTAYVRDPASGRTEQRRFDLRATRDSIHIYLVGAREFGPAYVTTAYADGSPASCRVRVNGGEVVTTSRYGLARIQLPQHGSKVELAAEDSSGRKGHIEQELYRGGGDQWLRVKTDKTLYHPGEPIHVEVTSSEPIPRVVLEILQARRLIDAQWLDLSTKSAKLTIPWRQAFVHEVTIGAATGQQYGDSASRTVLYPANRDLGLNVKLDQSTHRPGEDAVASFTAVSPSGKPVAAAVGVAVVDQAVGERARTDSESRGAFRLFGWDEYGQGAQEIAGVTRRELYRLDPAKPFDPDLDLVAEAMLAQDPYWSHVETSTNYREELSGEFGGLLNTQFQPVLAVLEAEYKKRGVYPGDLTALKQALAERHIDFEALRDPWDQPYRAEFQTVARWDRLTVISAGPDKQFGTPDDLTAAQVGREYFLPQHLQMVDVLDRLPAYPVTDVALDAALREGGVHMDEIRDPWGTAYRFHVEVSDKSVVTVLSAGPDRVFGTPDDFEVDRITGSYFNETRARLSKLLDARKSLPADRTSWDQLLRSEGLLPLKDPWGTTLYPVFQNRSEAAGLERYYTAARFGGSPQQQVEILPSTIEVSSIYLRSAGPDRVEGTADDFDLATFTRTERVTSAQEPAQSVPASHRSPTRNMGAIIGKVTDGSGALIPHAKVSAKRAGSEELQYVGETTDKGLYLIGALLPGAYQVNVSSPGFQEFRIAGILVTAGKATVVDATLAVGAMMESVEVTAQPMVLQTSTAMAAQVASGSAPQSTPRLREYFPETLLWAPFLETDAAGHAKVKFRLADNITTWKLEAIASTENGEVGLATADLRAFQPFFVDHAPPRVLTEGDEIQLPVTVRNYLDREQSVKVSLEPGAWFETSGGSRQEMRIASGGSSNAVFPIRAVKAVTNGKQRVTAQAAAAGDAIEKPVTVHPDGREMTVTQNGLMTGREGSIELSIPAGTLTGTLHAELKVYPNLLSHVVDSIEGIMQRPYGCGEQTISSTFPSLMVLRYMQLTGLQDEPLRKRAQNYLRAGLDRLLGYRNQDGSFTYWGRGDGDVYLTAYALTFLNQAQEFAEVDDDWIDNARDWLLKHVTADDYDASYVLLALSGNGQDEAPRQLVELLSADTAKLEQPYEVGVTALAARRVGQLEVVEAMLEKLRRAAHREKGMAWWTIEGRTPFNGWGLAGDLEATSVAVRALAASSRPADREIVGEALLYLLSHKDRFGVWHSSQATVQVLEAILDTGANLAADDGGPAEIMMNGRTVAKVDIPSGKSLSGPLVLDLSGQVALGLNRIILRRSTGLSAAQLQLTGHYYVSWSGESDASPASAPMRLSVAFDKTTARIGDDITCRVDAERVGKRQYGMMLAEIGVPPGVDVDRHSLDDAVAASGYALNHYDILPDRVVVYLWPGNGRAGFTFRFRPRMAMNAKSAPSSIYDYYNPDANAVAKPVKFHVE